MHHGEAYTDQLTKPKSISFSSEPIEREVETYLMTRSFNCAVSYSANEIVEFHGTLWHTDDVSLFLQYPHSHLLGKHLEVFATSGDNQDTIPIIHIPDWDFHLLDFHSS